MENFNLVAHLLERHCDLMLHRPALDFDENTATFSLYDFKGLHRGYQQYRPLADKKQNNHPKLGRYYTHRSCNLAPFGTETLDFDFPVVFLVEGIFDATRLSKYHVPVLASLSNNPQKDFWNQLLFLRKPIVVVRDLGDAGARLAKFGHHVELPDADDLGDASEEYVKTLIEKYR